MMNLADLGDAKVETTLQAKGIGVIATSVGETKWAVASFLGRNYSSLELEAAIYHDGQSPHTLERVGSLLIVSETGDVVGDTAQFVKALFG